MKSTIGPNDFNFESGHMDPGLGSHQPDEMTVERVRADAEANQRRQEALDRAAEVLRIESETADQKRADLDEREAELIRRERKVREAEASAGASDDEDSPRRKTARQATERVPA